MSPTRVMPPSEAMTHLAGKVTDLSTSMQAQQIDQQYIRKALDKLVLVGERQVELTAQIGSHSEAIDRVSRTVGDVKSELMHAVREVVESLKKDRDVASALQQTVAGFRGALRLLTAMGALIVGLVVYAFISTTGGLKEAQTALANKEERDRMAIEVKVDALSQQTQEVRLDRQRDVEAKDAKP